MGGYDQQLPKHNPSQSFGDMCRTASKEGNVIAIVGSKSDDDTLAAAAFKAWLLEVSRHTEVNI